MRVGKQIRLRDKQRGYLSAAMKLILFGGGTSPSFDLPLLTTLVPTVAKGSGTPTFTRATTAYVTDFEGLLKPVLSGEARFQGARRVRNIEAEQSEGNPATAVGAGTTPPTVTKQVTFDGKSCVSAAFVSGVASRADSNVPVGIFPFNSTNSYQGRFAIAASRPLTGSEALRVKWDGDASSSSVVFSTSKNLTQNWQTFAMGLTTFAGSGNERWYVEPTAALTSGITIYITERQAEIVTGQSNQNPSEYVSVGVLSAPYHGAGVDGVKYFATENGNTVASNVVTEATGAAISSATLLGYAAEGARTNLCLYSEDFTNAAWVASNITVASNAVAAPDGTTTADTLTASAGNGTILQTIVLASAATTFSIYLKRLTGTGNIDLTLDNGSTWTTKTITASWARYDITQTLANPVFGVRIVTNADAVYAWGGQVE